MKRIAPALLLLSVSGSARSKEREADPELMRGRYAHLFGGLEIGRGLRFNNPYRLETVLGDDARSLSLTATYLDLSAGAAFGSPDGVQQGAALHLSLALHGIPQEVVTPSYVLMWQNPPFRLHGRVGTPVVLEPDWNIGAEVAGGGAWLLSAGLGFGIELSASLFYGAETYERSATAIPIVSLQAGVAVDYEILP